MLRSLLTAFLMYSRLPVPQLPWKEENRRYALCSFPAVGAVLGASVVVWRLVCSRLLIGQVLFAAGCTLLGVLITGGIHLDGFCDVTDARNSYGDRERRLAILKDPHVGAFAVIGLCALLLWQTALYTELTTLRQTLCAACIPVLSRVLSAMSAICLPGARKDGSLQSFVAPADRAVSLGVLTVTGLAAAGLLLFLDPRGGCLTLCTAALVLCRYRAAALSQFGGVTGDTAGWFLSLCEVWCLTALVLAHKLTGGMV
ncbi:MAG: adenosylcobinamide-GDP ribazoletransferase [Oscillospiraceae bacterium]|nr:adenosylcobinamide-GDP ribazoletransferase [Oscillospiraceae bacterium]